MRGAAATLFAALSVSGCVNLAPDGALPAGAVPAAYRASLQPDGAVVAASMSYREFFLSDELESLIERALEQNRDLMAATARIEQARARFRIEDSRRLPGVDGTASGVRTRQALLDGAAGADGAGSVTSNRFDVGVAVTSFELDFWGRVRNLSEAARAEYLATEAAQQAFYLSLDIRHRDDIFRNRRNQRADRVGAGNGARSP